MKETDFKRTFTLRQHTPLIHFQHVQDGATLRATELKPKLDRFLIQKFGEEKLKHLQINDQKIALDYKVNIISPEKSTVLRLDDFDSGLYMGNMGEKNEAKKMKAVFANKPFQIEFFSFYPELLEAIDEYFTRFLAVTNFGSRQNKGFGSFFIEGKDLLEHLKQEEEKFLYIRNNQEYRQKFQHIKVIYSLMKSGINFGDFYYKSFLFIYHLEKLKNPMGNDKRFIKENFFKPYVRIAPDGVRKNYVRALLGVTDAYEFRDKERRGMVNISSETVDRFKSPITFKVSGNLIAIIPDNVNYKAIFDQTFEFEQRGSKQKIKTPVSFNLSYFLLIFSNYYKTIKDELIEDGYDEEVNRGRIRGYQKQIVKGLLLNVYAYIKK